MGKVKVLIVENEMLLANGIQSFLKANGYEVLDVVVSGKEAIESANKKNPDLVIMDIGLEGKMNGIEAAKKIKDDIDVPIIYLTNFIDDDTFKNAKETNPDHFLDKPFNNFRLKRAIELTLFNWDSRNNGQLWSWTKTKDPLKYVFLKNDKNQLERMNFEDILFVKGCGSYCEFYTNIGKFTLTYRIKAVENAAEGTQLVKVHRSYLVNISNINSFIGNKFAIIKYKGNCDINDLKEYKKEENEFHIPISEDPRMFMQGVGLYV